jgi:quercetin dioxygenase-like cupin family protein
MVRMLLTGAVLLAAGASVCAQEAGVQRKILLTEDGPPGFQTIVNALEFAPGAREVKHSHPGPLNGYVLEGTLVFEQEGRPTASYKAGDAFYVEPGKAHLVINSSDAPVKLLAMLVVEKGKPPSSPAPEQGK